MPARIAPARVAAFGAVAALALAAKCPAPEGCIVERVSDGDSITCGGERMRLLQIDAPELDQGDAGRRARAALEEILPVGSRATVATDVRPRDRHGRLLVYAYAADGGMANARMARRGFAVPLVIPPNVLHVEEIRAAADSARAEGAGLWAVGAFECSPREHRAGRCG